MIKLVNRRSVLRLSAAGAAVLAMPAIVRAQGKVAIRIGHAMAAKDPSHLALQYLAKNVAEKSDGRVEVTVFPADQLGRQKELGELVRSGANVMQLSDANFLGDWVPDASIMQAPYLLQDKFDFPKLLSSAWFGDIQNRLGKKNIVIVSNNNYFGSRNIIGDRPVRAPADVAGLNFRCAPAGMYVGFVRSIGARPVTTAWSETYTALAQGLALFAEAPLSTLYASKLFETAKHVSMTEHVVQWLPLIAGKSFYDRVPADVRELFAAEAQKAGEYMTELTIKMESEMTGLLEQSGVTFTRDVDREAFRKATAPLYDETPGWTPGLRDTVLAALQS